MAGNRAAFFVAANAATFAKKSSYTNISLADFTGVLDGPRGLSSISPESRRENLIKDLWFLYLICSIANALRWSSLKSAESLSIKGTYFGLSKNKGVF